MIALAAMSINRIIGKDGKLPWPSIKEDFAFFRKMTMGKSIVVGRTTAELLPPLKNRRIFILTHSSPATVLNLERTYVNHPNSLPPDVIVCGGAQIYSLLLPSCDKLYLTTVKDNYEGDTIMPPFERLFNPPTLIEDGQNYRIEEFSR